MGTFPETDGYVSRRTHETVQRVAIEVKHEISSADVDRIANAVVCKLRPRKAQKK